MRRSDSMGVVIPAVFIALALWFVVGSRPVDIPIAKPVAVDPKALDTAPRRTMLGDPPKILMSGMSYGCNDCHALFTSKAETPERILQHTNIRLDHGRNNQCFNCHDRADRNQLRLYGTQTVGFAESVLLCTKCHGPTYRNWQNGSHGKTTGYWDADAGPQRKLRCVECHDPHQPAFPPFPPLPGPNTLRMGDQSEHGHGSLNPLTQGARGPAHEPAPAHGEDAEEVHP